MPDFTIKNPKYRSSKVTNGLTMAGPRAHLQGMGLSREDMAKPFVAVINTHNEFHPGHVHLDKIADQVKAGILEAGGIPFEVNTVSICDGFTQGHEGMCSVLPCREVATDSIEVYINANQFDGMVLIGGCDKTIPSILMAALRVNIPAVIVTGGPMLPCFYKGNEYGTYQLKEMAGKLLKGDISESEYDYMEGIMSPGPGSCAMMGTANSMAICAEAMGLTLPGCASAHAVVGKKNRIARESGKCVMRLIEENIKPRDIVTQKMLDFATKVTLAVGGSTNITLHLPAIAKEAHLEMSLERIGQFSYDTPYLAKIKPSGTYTLWDFDQAGGVQAVIKSISEIENADLMTVNGKTHKENADSLVIWDRDVIRTVENANAPHGSIRVLKGNISPRGCVVKQSAVVPEMQKHTGPARCFESEEETVKAIYEGKIQHGDVIVIRNEGPKGGPGMREMLTATSALVGMGYSTTTALITDGRFSGATRGPCIGHISPETAEGGTIAVIEDGDMIMIDIPGGKLELLVPEEEIARRKTLLKPFRPRVTEGYLYRYAMSVSSADEGAILK